MTSHSSVNADLTKNQSLVMNTLSNSTSPLSAYTILDELRDQGFRAPLQVYRALDKLVELGLVHKLESLNSFVACQHPDCEKHETTAFMICEKCGLVGEISNRKLEQQIEKLAGESGFTPKTSTIELRGFCEACHGS